jgi:hypothetical protein
MSPKESVVTDVTIELLLLVHGPMGNAKSTLRLTFEPLQFQESEYMT